MGTHELLHLVVGVVYLVQRVVFIHHSVGFGACVGLAFQGGRFDDGDAGPPSQICAAAVERPFDCPSFSLGHVNYDTLKIIPRLQMRFFFRKYSGFVKLFLNGFQRTSFAN